jgi:hypothetical protein
VSALTPHVMHFFFLGAPHLHPMFQSRRLARPRPAAALLPDATALLPDAAALLPEATALLPETGRHPARPMPAASLLARGRPLPCSPEVGGPTRPRSLALLARGRRPARPAVHYSSDRAATATSRGHHRRQCLQWEMMIPFSSSLFSSILFLIR